MIFKRRFSAALLLLLSATLAAAVSSDDFKFDSDDLQVRFSRPLESFNVFSAQRCSVDVTINFKFRPPSQIVYSDPTEAAVKPPSRYLYTKEIAQCPTGESKMMLTLLLKSLRWSDVSERKKEKAIKKLSRFFSVPRVSFISALLLCKG